jgi:hypothetical protein
MARKKLNRIVMDYVLVKQNCGYDRRNFKIPSRLSSESYSIPGMLLIYLSMHASHDTHASYAFLFVDINILPLYCKAVLNLADISYHILTSSSRKLSAFDFTLPPLASVAPPSLRLYESQYYIISLLLNPISHSFLTSDFLIPST